MQSSQLTYQTSSTIQTSKTPKFKFLQRNLIFSRYNPRILKKVNLKGLYICNLIEDEPEDTEEPVINQASSRPYIRSKLWKGLRHLQISSFHTPYWQETLKRSQSLLSFKAVPVRDVGTVRSIATFIRRLPKVTESIKISIWYTEVSDPKCILKIPKALSCQRNLKIYKRFMCFEMDQDYLSRELELFKRYTSRLKKFERLIYDTSKTEQTGLQNFMKRDFKSPVITDLKIYLTPHGFEDFANLEDAYSDFEESNSNPDFDQEDQERMDEELSPFYRFHLFPNLQRLDLVFSNALYPLGPFVLKGFQSLQNLKELNLDIEKRSIGTKYLFQALLNLPLLKSFSLARSRLNAEDWELLTMFLQTQRELEVFKLDIEAEHQTRER